MKKTLLLAIAMISLNGLYAQISKDDLLRKWQTNQVMISRLLQAGHTPGAQQKPTGLSYRVIGNMIKVANGGSDSSAFKYSGTRSSNFNHDDPYYNYNAHFEGGYAPLPILPYSIDLLDAFFDIDPGNLQADTIRYYSNLSLAGLRSAAYNATHKVTRSSHNETGSPIVDARINAYNAQGRLSAAYTLQSDDNGLTFDTTVARTWTYNVAGTQIVADSIFENTPTGFMLSGVLQYYNNTAGKLDSIVLISSLAGPAGPVQKLLFSYYNDGKLRQVISKTVNIPAIQYESIDSFGYKPGAAYATYRQSMLNSTVDGESITVGTRTIKYPGANNLPDSAQVFDYVSASSSWELENSIKYSYTSFGAPSIITFTKSGALAATSYFYYESFENGTSLKPVTENKDFAIYPNPFHDHLSITWKKSAATKVGLTLFNISGQEVYRSTLQLHTGENTLALPALAPGNYLLLLSDSQGAAWSHKMIKQ